MRSIQRVSMMEMTFFFLMIGALNKYLRYPNSSSGISPCSLSFHCWFSLDRFVKPTSGFTLTLSTRCCLGFSHSITLIMHVGFPFTFGIQVHFSRQPQVSSFRLKGVVHSPQVPKAVFCYCYLSGARTEQWDGQRGWWGCGTYREP